MSRLIIHIRVAPFYSARRTGFSGLLILNPNAIGSGAPPTWTATEMRAGCFLCRTPVQQCDQ